MRENGTHVWKLKHFKKTAFCNLCQARLVHFGTQGLSCTGTKLSHRSRGITGGDVEKGFNLPACQSACSRFSFYINVNSAVLKRMSLLFLLHFSHFPRGRGEGREGGGVRKEWILHSICIVAWHHNVLHPCFFALESINCSTMH